MNSDRETELAITNTKRESELFERIDPLYMDEELKEYFKEHGMPKADWMGWHPSIPQDAIQIKTIQGGIGNVAQEAHRFNYYPSQIREATARFGYVEPALPEIYPDDGMAWLRDLMTSESSFRTTSNTNITTLSFQDDRRDDVFHFLNDMRRR